MGLQNLVVVGEDAEKGNEILLQDPVVGSKKTKLDLVFSIVGREGANHGH